MIYDANEARQIDEWARTSGLPVEVLMERAGQQVAAELKQRHTKTDRILIICGTGNNGGDGYVIARELVRDDYDVTVQAPLGPTKTETARLHETYAEKFGVVAEPPCGQYDVIVDALFGTGFDPKRINEVTEKTFDMVKDQRRQGAIVYAIDVPSGVPSDAASDFSEEAVRANQTFCLHAYKRSAFLLKAAPFYGDLELVDIGLPNVAEWELFEEPINRLFERQHDGHKGTYGTALLIGGSETMPGSIQLATRAALRTGVGKLQVATVDSAKIGLLINAPEAMVLNQTTETIQAMLDQVTAVGIGPGVTSDKIADWIELAFTKDIPIVLDAAALIREDYPERRAPIVVTPHIGEFARMTNKAVVDIQDDLFEAASDYAMLHQVTVVLKSHVILIAKPDGGGYVISGASSGLAKGGSGDTLFGLITSLLAQRKYHDQGSVEHLIAMGVAWYARASKRIEQRIHPSSIVATDLIDELARRI